MAAEDDDVDTSTTSQALHIGTFDLPSGQQLVVSQIAVVDASFTRLASCGQTLVLAKSDGSLFTSVDPATGTFRDINKKAPSDKIACDRLHLYALRGTKVAHAIMDLDGTLSGAGVFEDVGALPSQQVTEIASGNGNIYAITGGIRNASVWTSQLKEKGSAQSHVQGETWTSQRLVSADLITGAGSKAWWNGWADPGGPYHTKRNRAFTGGSTSNALAFNDSYIEGLGSFTSFPNANIDILQISAEDSNTLYALAATPPTTGNSTYKRIIRYAFHETNCRDGLDNDANGLRDTEDPRCRSKLANEWCATRSSGSFCIDRIQNTDGYDHALVTCRPNGEQATIDEGLCVKDASTGGGADYINKTPTINESDTGGRYCSVIFSDGTWTLEWGEHNKTDPCGRWRMRPGARIVRAGQFSMPGVNNVLANCMDGSHVSKEGVGTAPLIEARDAVRGRSRCVFTASPKNVGIFMAPFPRLTWETGYGKGYDTGHFFDHARRCPMLDTSCPCAATSATPDCPIAVSPFGNGQTGEWTMIDNRGWGVEKGGVNQLSYDFGMTEGVPLRAMAKGTVVMSRDFPIYPLAYSTVDPDTAGTPFMGEIYIRYDIGSDPDYQESYLAYYAHVGLRTVTTGQTVEANQRIGFVGTTGNSGGPHLHFGVYRLTNINLQGMGAGNEGAGWKHPFEFINTGMGYTDLSLAGAVDPYGWRAPSDGTAASQDPAAHVWKDVVFETNYRGIGAWSPNLWYDSNNTPPFPK